MTLYYTTDAYPTLGGRDVMMATRDAITEPWRQPANPGMPLNSIYDEVLYVTDATDSIGWIRTMRNFPDTFEPTVYVLKLNDMRTNLDPDSVDIQSRAFIRNIEDTWPEGFDAGEWQLRVEEARSIKNQVPGGRQFADSARRSHFKRVPEGWKCRTEKSHRIFAR